MEIAVFDIKADYGFFKAFEATRGNFSFPFPPRTALLGQFAAILGLEYNSYWNEHPLNNTLVALELRAPIKRVGMKMNYIQSRKIMKFQSVEIILPKDPADPDARGFTTQLRLDLLKDVHFRIYFHIPDKKLMKELTTAIKKHTYHYPPYLGHANLLCELEWLGIFQARKLTQTQTKVGCVIPLSTITKNPIIESGVYTIIRQVPMEYRSEQLIIPEFKLSKYKIQTIRYEDFMVQEDLNSKISVSIENTDFAYEIEMNANKIPILFFPA